MHPVIRLVQQHRRTLAQVVLAVGTALVLLQFWPLLQPLISPETVVELELGPEHAQVLELRLVYLLEGEELRVVNFRFQDGAPATVRHRVSLPTGELELQCVLRVRNGESRVLTRRLHAPAEGLVRISVAGAA
jgi:hypothetical protein